MCRAQVVDGTTGRGGEKIRYHELSGIVGLRETQSLVAAGFDKVLVLFKPRALRN